MNFHQLKCKMLAQHLELLMTQYREAYQQLDQMLSAADKITVKQIISQLEVEIADVERQLVTLECGGSSAPAIDPAPVNPKTDAPVWKQIGIEMVYILGGKFLSGEEKQMVYLDEIWISRTPVTNRQYEAFVNATGHERPGHWEDRALHPSKANYPVISVSWHDAQAFCEWAGVYLPTEQQWEKAARSVDGRKYPWGDEPPTDDLCNFNNNAGGTTLVGRYSPQGDSPYGLVDMVGNVWEWCEDQYGNARESRVLRGGAWLNDENLVRCANSLGYYPYGRGDDIGFRVVSSVF